MNEYLEQSIGGEVTARQKLIIALCWVAIVGFACFGMFNCASIFAGESINWLALILTVLSLGVIIVLFRSKDKIVKEYDYILSDDTLEVSVIYSGKRRKLCARIGLNTIERCGPALGNVYQRTLMSPGAKPTAWNLGGERQTFLYYNEGTGKRLVLLDLDEAMATQLKRSRKLQRGAWADSEGKTY